VAHVDLSRQSIRYSLPTTRYSPKTKPPASIGGAGGLMRTTRRMARRSVLMHGSVPQARDLVLQLQLATLEFYDFQIVDRGMLLSFEQFTLQRLMPQFEFRKMRLDGHRRGLLMSDFGA
jgi:hypothetical protein